MWQSHVQERNFIWRLLRNVCCRAERSQVIQVLSSQKFRARHSSGWAEIRLSLVTKSRTRTLGEAAQGRAKIIQVLIAILLTADLQNRLVIDSLQMFLNGRRELLKRRKKNFRLRKYVLNRILILPIKQALILIMKNLVPASSLTLREQGMIWSWS